MNERKIKNIPVLFCINNNYIFQLIVIITSILENSDKSYTFYIFHSEDFTPENMDLLNGFDKTRCKFVFQRMQPSLLQKFKLTDNERTDISLDTYSRFFAPKFITEQDKIIYLDADIIVNKDISSLYDIDMEDNYVAGVEERCLYQTDYIESKLHFSKDEIYINCGVLLMNLKKMREDNFLDKIFEQAPVLLPFVKYADQDILNLIARGKIKKIDCKYNMTPSHVRDFLSKRSDAVIIHYTGKLKPWTLGKFPNDLNYLYLKYYNKSFLAERQTVKLFCVYHAPAFVFENELIQPIQTGTYGKYDGMDMQQASAGIQIDYKNKNYGELSAWYWVWKNYIPAHKNIKYIGFCHYRRMMDYENCKENKGFFLNAISLSDFIDKFNYSYTADNVYNKIKGYDVVLPRKHPIENGLSVEEQYLACHPKHDMDLLKNIIRRDYPEYVEAMDKVLTGNTIYFCLLYTMKTEHYCEFMEFAFDILSKLEKESDWSEYKDYNSIRVPAYLIERFFNVWLEYNKNKYNWKILERDAYIFEEYLPKNVTKLFGLPVYKKKAREGKTKYYFLGIPIIKRKKKENTVKFYLFGFIPMLKIKKC